MAETDASEVAELRRRAHERIADYLGALPHCSVDRYSAEERQEHESAQRRVLQLCASDDDRAALVEFLIGFTYFVEDLRDRAFTVLEDGKPRAYLKSHKASS